MTTSTSFFTLKSRIATTTVPTVATHMMITGTDPGTYSLHVAMVSASQTGIDVGSPMRKRLNMVKPCLMMMPRTRGFMNMRPAAVRPSVACPKGGSNCVVSLQCRVPATVKCSTAKSQFFPRSPIRALKWVWSTISKPSAASARSSFSTKVCVTAGTRRFPDSTP